MLFVVVLPVVVVLLLVAETRVFGEESLVVRLAVEWVAVEWVVRQRRDSLAVVRGEWAVRRIPEREPALVPDLRGVVPERREAAPECPVVEWGVEIVR